MNFEKVINLNSVNMTSNPFTTCVMAAILDEKNIDENHHICAEFTLKARN